MLRLRTKVTSSPAMRRRRSSATSATSRTSGPRALKSVTISASPTSWPSATPASTSATAPRPVSTAPPPAAPCGGGPVRSSSRGGGSSPPEHHASSRARPSASDASSTGNTQRRVEPARRLVGEGRVDGQAGGERVAGRLGGLAQNVECGPGPLGVHMVGRDRRDAAPVVDPGVEQRAEVVGEIGWRLHVDVGRQHEPGRGNGPHQVLGRTGRRLEHGRARLGQEVLDDDLLDVPVAGVRGGNGPQGGQLVGPGVADADQDARGEGDGQLPGGLQGGQTAGRHLVGRAAVGVEALGQRLEHHALAGRHRAQRGQLGGVERAGVGVGEQAGLLDDEAAHGGQVVDRRGIALLGQPLRRHRVAQLGPLAQSEQGLVAAGRLTGLGDGQYLLGEEIGRGDTGRCLGEGAVAALVPAEHGQRDEDLGREGDPPSVRTVAHDASQRGQVVEWGREEIGVGEH